MKPQKRLILTIVTVLGVLLAFAAPIAAQASITEITGTEVCHMFNPINPGTWTFPDGNVHVRGMVFLCRDESSDPRETGNIEVVMDANWDSNMLGPIYGTFRTVTDEGGVWEGTWEGLVTTSGFQYHVIGMGQGRYEGMKIWLDYVNGVFQGRILDPHGD